MTSSCSIFGCETLAVKRGWCNMHYLRWHRHGDPFATLCPTLVQGTAEERFWPKVNKDGPISVYRPDLGPCWLWAAGRNGKAGYGRFWSGKRFVYAHRFAYELLVGPIPEGLTIDHLCRVTLCLNPAHLEPVTLWENGIRGIKGVLTQHCPQGHPYDEVNTRWNNDRIRSRSCRTCKAAYDRRRTRATNVLS